MTYEDQLIIYVLSIREFAKDIHYTCHGDGFYGKHLLADRVYNELDGFVDKIKEAWILGNNLKVLSSRFYLQSAADLLIKPNEQSDVLNFEYLRELMQKCIIHLSNANEQSHIKISDAEQDIIGTLASTLKNLVGLINLQLK